MLNTVYMKDWKKYGKQMQGIFSNSNDAETTFYWKFHIITLKTHNTLTTSSNLVFVFTLWSHTDVRYNFAARYISIRFCTHSI